jgi:hypothetical protein
MLEFLHGRASDRQLRLFACACCRRLWDVLTDQAGRDAVVLAESFADGEASADELDLAADAVCTRHGELEEGLDQAGAYPAEEVRLYNAVEAAWQAGQEGRGCSGPVSLDTRSRRLPVSSFRLSGGRLGGRL